MTGRYQHRVGGLECAIGVHNVGRYDDAIRLAAQHQLGLPVEEGSLALYLKQAGYTCGLFGKWHLGYEPHFHPLRHGFDRAFGVLGGNADYFRHTEEDGWNVLFDDERLIERDGYLTDLITDEALRWYHQVKERPQPFFLYLPYTCPHTPIQGPEDDTGQLVSADKWNAGSRETYARMIEQMDRQIGRLLTAMDADGKRRNTLVIFQSDNGGTRLAHNVPWSGQKGTTHEGGIRVPCLVRWPGQLPEGRVVNNVSITMDFTRSLLRIAGVAEPADRPLDGIDILQEIATDQPPHPRTLFWRGRRGDNTWRAVRDGNLKALWRQDGDRRQGWLFDLAADPSEQTDLSQSHPQDFQRLAAKLAAWELEVRPNR